MVVEYPSLEATRREILERDWLRIGLVVRSKVDGSRAIFPSSTNYSELVSAPYFDSRTHSLQDNHLALRETPLSQDNPSLTTNVLRVCSIVPTSAPPCRHGYALLNNDNHYSLRCPVCSSQTWRTRRRRYMEHDGNVARTPFLDYDSFFHHCHNCRTTRYPTPTHNFRNEWTTLTDNPQVLHVAITIAIQHEWSRITKLFFKEEITEILRAQPSFEAASTEVIDHILFLTYRLEAIDQSIGDA